MIWCDSMLDQYEAAVAALPDLTSLYNNINSNAAPSVIRPQLVQLNTSLNLMPDTSKFVDVALQLNRYVIFIH
jgi:hypothetical protein